MTGDGVSSGAESARLRIGLSRPDLLRERAFIDGTWVSHDRLIPVRNPATGDPIGSVPSLDGSVAESAVAAAYRAFPSWRALAAHERSRILKRWHGSITAHADDLARLMTAEQGKPLSEARAEIAYAASFVAWFAEEAVRVYGETIPGHQANKRLQVLREPIGVVAAITPWNFPAAMITRKVAPALAAGCTAVVKPSELTPFSALALALLATEAGVPRGVLNVVTGAPAPIGEVLTGDPRIGKFTFTGSTSVGKVLAARCMSTVKRVSLELGGNAPFIVFDDADMSRALDGAMSSKFRNAGQTCVCANRFLVQDAVFADFAAQLAQRSTALVVGNGFEPRTQLGPLISSAALEKVHAHVTDALAGGATLLTGGRPLEGTGSYYHPTVIAGVTPQMKLFQEETFGPVAGITRFHTEEEAIALANGTRAGLAAYVYTNDLNRSYRVTEALEYGMVGLNTGLISTAVAPFGGMKESGLGREGSRHGIDDYLEMKLVCCEVP